MRRTLGLAIVLLSSVAFADPELRDTWAKLGAEPGGSSPEAFRALIDKDVAKWGKVVREAKITLE